MMHSTPSAAVASIGPRSLHNRVATLLTSWIGHDLLALAARFGIAGVFWLSGRTKVEGWLTVSDSAMALFADEYKVPLLPPGIAAHLAAYAEHLFPILLVLGLFTRASALALLAMTAVIQIFVYPDAWPTHLVWATALLYPSGAARTLVARCAARSANRAGSFLERPPNDRSQREAFTRRFALTAARLHALKNVVVRRV
jgi:putative oxidoreductase